jgi:hypothetical protein
VERVDTAPIVHEDRDRTWSVSDGDRQVQLAGHRSPIVMAQEVEVPTATRARKPTPIPRSLSPEETYLRFPLGREHYRRSESSWEEAGRPTAEVRLSTEGDDLVISIDVNKLPTVFAPAREENPLDNEHPDINSDGAQVHAWIPEVGQCVWLFVPESQPQVRVSRRHGGEADTPPESEPSAQWHVIPGGWSMTMRLPRRLGAGPPFTHFLLDVIVNEIAPGRERRRGQLVLSGGGDWIYLRGDRQSPAHFLPFVIADE